MKIYIKYCGLVGFVSVVLFLPVAAADTLSHSSKDSGIAQPVLSKEIVRQAFKKLNIEIPIRVLLDERNAQKDVNWKFSSIGGFLVFEPKTKQKTVYKTERITVTCKGGRFFTNGRALESDHLFIIPLRGPVYFQKNMYDGVLALTITNDSVYLVNHLDLEDYLLAVLPYESWPAWPDEVHKAFCIAFRSYGIAKVLEQRAKHEQSKVTVPYDIKNTNAHQIYKGRSYTNRFKNIIEETRGIVLAHKGKPILAMFDICCGGVIPGHKEGIHFYKAPHLKRTYPCNFCKEYKYFTWTAGYSFDDLEKALKNEIPASSGSFQDIKVTRYDKALVAREVKVKAGNRWYNLPASRLKACLKEIRSLCFKIQKKGRFITISGKGHGHHMGLCQRGAYAMVLKNWHHKNILKFYYPHTQFMKLKKINY